MNNDRNLSALPPQIEGVLKDRHQHGFIDNLFADTWKQLKVSRLIRSAGFTKRSGLGITEAVFVLLLWKWLNVSSIALFAQKAIGMFSKAKKDVLYDLLKREDINWRDFNLQTAKAVYREQSLEGSRIKVFALDDSIKTRRGKKMESVSSHFDHVTNRHVMGQQVLTLGLATEEAFLPLDSQIYVSQTKAKALNQPYRDGRSIAAKRYQEATTQSKPIMAANMMKRVLRAGIEADYLVADAWFGTKSVIRSALDLDTPAILRMKKGKMKYRVTVGGKKVLLDAKQLYVQVVKREWKKVRGMPWRAASIKAELDLSEDHKVPRWQEVTLLFVRGVKEAEKPEAGKKDWALFLSTDPELGMSRILEIYALRWSIEVYFKEAKQHLGFLAEQTTTFASHTASIHLCAVRYLMLVHAKLSGQGCRVGEIRAEIQDQLDAMSFAGRLWQVFRALICSTLNEFKNKLNCPTAAIMHVMDKRVREFFIQSLQLDAFTMRLEHE